MKNDKEPTKLYWNSVHASIARENIAYDDWLDLFIMHIKRCRTPIIDLGCGSGNDTLYLLDKGKAVIPCDISLNAINNIKVNFPEIERAECFDMSEGLPFGNDSTDLVIADLSLHYFCEDETAKIINEIKRVLSLDGILLFRVNSINDVNYGAGQGTKIEKNFYETRDCRYKRFFDEEDIRRFFVDWEILYAKKEILRRYKKEKVLWRCAVKPKIEP